MDDLHVCRSSLRWTPQATGTVRVIHIFQTKVKGGRLCHAKRAPPAPSLCMFKRLCSGPLRWRARLAPCNCHLSPIQMGLDERGEAHRSRLSEAPLALATPRVDPAGQGLYIFPSIMHDNQ